MEMGGVRVPGEEVVPVPGRVRFESLREMGIGELGKVRLEYLGKGE